MSYQMRALCPHGRQRSKCKECGGAAASASTRRAAAQPVQGVRRQRPLQARAGAQQAGDRGRGLGRGRQGEGCGEGGGGSPGQLRALRGVAMNCRAARWRHTCLPVRSGPRMEARRRRRRQGRQAPARRRAHRHPCQSLPRDVSTTSSSSSSIFEHGRRRSECKDECGGSGICEHGRRRSRCKELRWHL